MFPPSLSPSRLHPFLPPFLHSPLPPSHPPSLPPSLLPSLPPPLPLSFPPSLPPSLAPTLPSSLPYFPLSLPPSIFCPTNIKKDDCLKVYLDYIPLFWNKSRWISFITFKSPLIIHSKKIIHSVSEVILTIQITSLKSFDTPPY